MCASNHAILHQRPTNQIWWTTLLGDKTYSDVFINFFYLRTQPFDEYDILILTKLLLVKFIANIDQVVLALILPLELRLYLPDVFLLRN